MNNYEYIVASLPVLSADYRGPLDSELVVSQIREQLSDADNKALDQLLSGFEGSNLDAAFYNAALASKCRFIREWFAWDLDLRNCKVEFLNKALGRPEGTDILCLDPEAEPRESEYRAEMEAAFATSDLLGREKSIDELNWSRIDEITGLEVFTLGAILGFVAKMQIVARWTKLDEQTGRELFARLVDEIRNNKKPIEQ